MKASIRVDGVVPKLSAYDGKDGFSSVYARGRRLTALQDLVIAVAIEADAKISCVLKDANDAAERSLVENVMRASDTRGTARRMIVPPKSAPWG